MNIQNSRHLPTARDSKRHGGDYRRSSHIIIADSIRVAPYVEMSVANTNLYWLCRVVVTTNRSISLLISHRGVQQRLPKSIANLLDVTVASSKSTLADSDIFTRLGYVLLRTASCAMT